MEAHADDPPVLTAHEADISFLRDEVNELKLEDLKNRSGRCNMRIRGLSKSITDLYGTVTALFQKLTPNIPPEHLEFDRVNRGLTRKRADCPLGISF